MTEAAAPVAAPPGLAETIGWLGSEVDAVGGTRVGRVRAVFADAATGEPAWLIVGLKRRLPLLGPKRRLVALPLRDCAAGGRRVWTAHARGAIVAAPTVDPTRPLLREHELAICAHYGIGERVGRAAEVRERAEGSVTSGPSLP